MTKEEMTEYLRIKNDVITEEPREDPEWIKNRLFMYNNLNRVNPPIMKQVIQKIIEGESYEKIANEMGITSAKVQNYRKAFVTKCKRKLGKIPTRSSLLLDQEKVK